MTENDTIQLYHHHKSTCSQKVRICLAEKEILWTSRFVDISKEENLSAEYLAINPNGVVPAIKHLGRNIIESSVIVEYLDEVFESGYQLTPDDPIDRANMRAWLRYIDEVPSMAVRVPSYQLVLRKRFDAMSEGEYEAFINKNPLRNEFFSRMGRGGFND
ncbi:MAG: glutathione S-transferase family protein [Planctomycetes bacterium]|nr:glutathione S-transferase family protein [Planctomycetota bacterium]